MKKKYLQEVKEVIKGKDLKVSAPFIIALSGLPGSGKTTAAETLSKRTNAYLLSSNYVRNNLYEQEKDKSSEKVRKKIQRKTAIIQFLRMIKLMIKKIPIIIDADMNTTKRYKFLKSISKIFAFKFLAIRIESPNLDTNYQRISKRAMDLRKVNPNIIGDNTACSNNYSREVFNQIIERKPQNIQNIPFDYTIKNDSNKNNFQAKVRRVGDKINQRTRKN